MEPLREAIARPDVLHLPAGLVRRKGGSDANSSSKLKADPDVMTTAMERIHAVAVNNRTAGGFPWRPWAVGLLGFLIAFMTFWMPHALRHWQGAPLGTDAVPYVNIAIQVARGNGLQENAADPALVAIWQGSFVTPPPSAPQLPFPTTRWPPLFPLLIGMLFRLWGYDLVAARTLNCLTMAAACGIVAGVLTFRRGWISGLIFIAIFALVDERLRANARVVMTEPLATLFVSATGLLLFIFARHARLRTAVVAGAVLGLAALARSITLLWVPGLTVLVMWLAWRFSACTPRRAGTLASAFALTVVAVCSPWFVHNCRALGAFMPLGTHIYTLPSGFSDEAWNRGGVWYSLGDQFFAGVVAEGDPPLVAARKIADFGRQRAIDWIIGHPLKAAILGVRKAMTLWIPNPSIEVMYLIFPLIGMLAMARDPETVVIAAFLLLNTLTVAATWTWEGDRFQVPLLGLLHYAGAVGVSTAFRKTRALAD
jgi:hypothetical protein